jgi:Ca2+-binding RTX toxin-like protein
MAGSNRGGSPVQIDALEARRLLAGASVIHDALLVRGGPSASNTIVVADSADGSAVDVRIDSVNRRGVTKHFDASFPKSLGFTLVRVRGGAQNDTLSFGDASHPFALPVRANGFAGDDTITGGEGDDKLAGGLGHDTIHGGKGSDVVRGGRDDDDLFGDDGDDILWGGGGNDALDAGTGNDKLGGILGTNKMIGGDGADEFLVRSADQNPDSDFLQGTDILTIALPKKAQNNAPKSEAA